MNTSLGDDAITMADCPTDCVLRHLGAELSLLDDASNSDAVRACAHPDVHWPLRWRHSPAPLHAGYARDRGGNRHRIRGASGGNDLPYVWDSYFIRSLAQDWRQCGQDLHADINPIDHTVWVDDGATIDDRMLTWANESFRIPEDYVYQGLTCPGDRELGPTYVQGNLPTIERQLKKAGLRLGQLLNEVLDPRMEWRPGYPIRCPGTGPYESKNRTRPATVRSDSIERAGCPPPPPRGSGRARIQGLSTDLAKMGPVVQATVVAILVPPTERPSSKVQ